MPHLGRYKTRRLPHRDYATFTQAITYRLTDSLPEQVVARAEATLKIFPPEELSQRRREVLHSILDKGLGSCILRHPQAAQACISEWQKYDGERYDLLAWTVMPNHAHVLIRQYPEHTLGEIVGTWKGAASHAIATLGPPETPSPLWQRGYWDRHLRHHDATARPVDYIRQNPVKAGLCRHPDDWPFTGGSLVESLRAAAREGRL